VVGDELLNVLRRLRDMNRVDVQAQHLTVAADALGEQLKCSARATGEVKAPPSWPDADPVKQRDGVLGSSSVWRRRGSRSEAPLPRVYPCDAPPAAVSGER